MQLWNLLTSLFFSLSTTAWRYTHVERGFESHKRFRNEVDNLYRENEEYEDLCDRMLLQRGQLYPIPEDDADTDIEQKKKDIFSYFIDRMIPKLNETSILQHYPSAHLPSFDNLIMTKSYLSSVNTRFRVPNWVSEILTPDMINGQHNRERCSFHSDPHIDLPWKTTTHDYAHSGFTRGHMAAAANHKNEFVSD